MRRYIKDITKCGMTATWRQRIYSNKINGIPTLTNDEIPKKPKRAMMKSMMIASNVKMNMSMIINFRIVKVSSPSYNER